jgi:hypothetical protein
VAALEGEIVGREVSRRVAVEPASALLHYKIHVVDLPNGGRIDGMGRADALAIAARLGTRAYEARATLNVRTGLVVVRPIERIQA